MNMSKSSVRDRYLLMLELNVTENLALLSGKTSMAPVLNISS